MYKAWVQACVCAGGLLLGTVSSAYPVLDIMNKLADESKQLNDVLRADASFAQLLQLSESQGAALSLMGVGKLDKQGVNVIVHRNDADSYQYQRLKGLAAPFFVLVQNRSNRPITIEPYKISLNTANKKLNPIPHRRMETLLTRTNMKKATLGDMVSKITTVAMAGASLAASGTNIASLTSDSMMSLASGQSVENTALKMLDNPALKGFKQLAEKEMAEQFKEGDERFVQPESITLRPYEIITFNTFFENVSIHEPVELSVYIDGSHQHRFQFIDPNSAGKSY